MKEYVKPEGRVVPLHVNENIASSGNENNNSSFVLEYTHGIGQVCRTYITGNTDQKSYGVKWMDMAFYFLTANSNCTDGIIDSML